MIDRLLRAAIGIVLLALLAAGGAYAWFTGHSEITGSPPIVSTGSLPTGPPPTAAPTTSTTDLALVRWLVDNGIIATEIQGEANSYDQAVDIQSPQDEASVCSDLQLNDVPAEPVPDAQLEQDLENGLSLVDQAIPGCLSGDTAGTKVALDQASTVLQPLADAASQAEAATSG